MTTVANVRKESSSHWYYANGAPCFELPKKSGAGMKSPNLTDARELNLLPSVTTILKVLHKPALQDWLIEQAVLAVMTTPRMKEETQDEFIHRVLQVERVQDQEAKSAADKGTAIHDAIECAINGKPFDDAWRPYVQAVFPIIESLGKVAWSEKIVVGDGYAGRSDLLIESDSRLILTDFKTSKTMPKKESWLEHKLQTAAYARTLGNTADKHVITANIYISTVIPGQAELFLQEDWVRTYTEGFAPLLKYWQYANSYVPEVRP